MNGNKSYDLVIKNGRIIDGTGSPSYVADVAVKAGKIVEIAKGLKGGRQVIDAKGLVVTPGFIDSHSHSDNAVLTYPDQREKIEQGITTSIGGQCGESIAPVSRDVDPKQAGQIGDFGKYTDVCRTMGTFLDIAKNVPQGSNIAMFVGHGALRCAVMGMEDRAPSVDELEKMKWLLRDAMEHGALGISFGLVYSPGCYADTEELIALAKVVGEYHGLVAAHIRNEGDQLVKATEEFIRVVKAASVRGILSHHKASKIENWGKVSHTLRMLEDANEQGIDIYCDVYPYVAWNTSLSSTFIPKEYRTGGTKGMIALLQDPQKRAEIKVKLKEVRGQDDLSWALIAKCAGFPEYEGKRLNEIAALHGKDVYETIFDILVKSCNSCNVCGFTMCEEDMETVLAYPRAMICTDSSVARDFPIYHPRLRGSFPRVLGRYVRERKVTTLPEMIRKMTSMPAAVYGLKGKGLLREGFDADICIFDPDKIIDRAEFVQCHERAEGLNFVILSGEVVVEDAVYNGKRRGKVILR